MKTKIWILSVIVVLGLAACGPYYVRMSDPDPFEPLSAEVTETPEPIPSLPAPFLDIQPQQSIAYSLVNPEKSGFCKYDSCGIKVVLSGDESGLANYELETNQNVFLYLIDHLILTINGQQLPSNFPTGYSTEHNDQRQITSVLFSWNPTLLPGLHHFDLRYIDPSGAESEVSWSVWVIDDREE